MSVLIKGMKMPTSCRSCRFAGFGGRRCELNVCIFTGESQPTLSQGRMSACPLVTVPPHGRLIDGDKLAEEQKENVRAYHANLITLDDLAECLLKQSISEDGAPTIIPAEEENK